MKELAMQSGWDGWDEWAYHPDLDALHIVSIRRTHPDETGKVYYFPELEVRDPRG